MSAASAAEQAAESHAAHASGPAAKALAEHADEPAAPTGAKPTSSLAPRGAGQPAEAAPSAPPAPVQRLRAAVFACAVSLILLCLAWELWLAPTGRGTLAVKALPLVLALPGLARHRLYTYRWLSLLVWLYVLEGLVRATSEPGLGAAMAGAEVALAVALFGTATFYIRRRLAGAAAPRGAA